MRIFPQNDYLIELKNDISVVINELENKTLSKEQFVSNWNNQVFIGKIKKNEFEIKLSKKLFGELCVLKGKLENKKGTLEIRTGKIFKIGFLLIILSNIIVLITVMNQNKVTIIFYIIMSFLSVFSMRFIFLEFGFKYISKKAIIKLTEIIGIKEIKIKV